MTRTRAEIRIAAAKKRWQAADDAVGRALDAKHKAVNAAAARHQSRIREAGAKARKARADLSVAEMAAYGIVPMETIFTVPSRGPGRYAASIAIDGYVRLVPVGKSGRVMGNRNPTYRPSDWANARLTGETVRT